jgi:hypothetical protein
MESQEGDIQAAPEASPEPVPAQSATPPALPAAPDAVAASGTEVVVPSPSFTWEASEYVFHEKPFAWYIGLWAVTAVLCGGLGLMRQWLSIVVVVITALAVMVYSRKEPRTLGYALDEHGISIDGKLSPYHLFKSYSVHEEVSWQEIDLEPARRFAPRLTVLCEHDSFDQINEILTQHLPRLDRDPDWVEQLTRYIKF